MDYPCAKFDDFSFCRFGFIVRTDRHRDGITDADDRYTDATTSAWVTTMTGVKNADVLLVARQRRWNERLARRRETHSATYVTERLVQQWCTCSLYSEQAQYWTPCRAKTELPSSTQTTQFIKPDCWTSASPSLSQWVSVAVVKSSTLSSIHVDNSANELATEYRCYRRTGMKRTACWTSHESVTRGWKTISGHQDAITKQQHRLLQSTDWRRVQSTSQCPRHSRQQDRSRCISSVTITKLVTAIFDAMLLLETTEYGTVLRTSWREWNGVGAPL